MSHPFRRTKQIARIGVEPDRLRGAVYSTHARGPELARTLPSVPMSSSASAAEALNLMLEAAAPVEGVEIKLSSAIARFAVCEWPKHVWRESEILRRARARLAEIYGSEGEWTIAVDHARAQARFLTVAVKRELCLELTHAVSKTGASLLSMRPVLSDVVNTLARDRSTTEWLAALESRAAVVVQFRRGSVHNLRQMQAQEPPVEIVAHSMGRLATDPLQRFDVSERSGFEYWRAGMAAP